MSTPSDEQARRNAVIDAMQARADRAAIIRVRDLADSMRAFPDSHYWAEQIFAALDGTATAEEALPDGRCVHLQPGACCSGPGYCAHACNDAAPGEADRG